MAWIIYCCVVHMQVIMRQEFGGVNSMSESIITCCLSAPEDLAVDWLGRNLYWTDSQRRVIEVALLDGGGRGILSVVPESLGPPGNIALDPFGGWAQKIVQSDYHYIQAVQTVSLMSGCHCNNIVLHLDSPHQGNFCSKDTVLNYTVNFTSVIWKPPCWGYFCGGFIIDKFHCKGCQ